MKTLGFMVGVAIVLAICTVCVLLLNAELEKQKRTVCYVAMAIMDVVYVVYMGAILLRLFGIV